MDSTVQSFGIQAGPAAINVTSGTTELAPVAWLRAHPAAAVAIAGAAAYALFQSKAIGITLLAAAAGLWLLHVTTPPPASTVSLQLGNTTLQLQ